jgi:hypothetical protein
MSRRPGHERYPTVIAWFAVALVILTLAIQVNGAEAVTLNEAVEGQQLLCRVLGSHPEPPVTRTTPDGRSFARVACHGGLLDGATCDIFPGTDADDAVASSCYLASAGEDIHVVPDGGVEDVSDRGPGGVGNVAVDPVVAEDPTRGEPVVIPGFSVDEVVRALTDSCHILGGADVEIYRPEADAPPGSIDVRCIGGLLYDLHCTVAVESLTCQWLEPPVEATVDVVLTDVKVVGRAPTPAAELVDTPTPTPPMDNDSGTDPTAPSTFTAPGNVGDNRAPPGGVAEDPTQNEPTPTEAPLR